MAKDLKSYVFDGLKAGVPLTATVLVVNWIIQAVGFQVNELFGVQPATGITETIGERFIALLQSFVAFEPMSLLTVYISGVAILVVGQYLRDSIGMLPSGSGWSRMALALVYGTAVFYLLLVGTGLPGFGTLIGLGVYVAAVSLLYRYAEDFLKNIGLM